MFSAFIKIGVPMIYAPFHGSEKTTTSITQSTNRYIGILSARDSSAQIPMLTVSTLLCDPNG